VVRNPLYVFSFLGLAGIGLQSGSVTVLFLLVTAFVLYYREVVSREEAFLEDKFGAAYRSYKEQVPRWWPKLSLWTEPSEIVTRPYFIRHTMLDAVVFFLPLPLMELLEILHQNEIIPTLMRLP